MIKLRNAMRGDSGVALVMAMGIALIGMTVAIIVVTAVVMASNDSGRDRVRTVEVHSAEAAIDATMAELQTGVPCAPSFSPASYGTGVTKTTVTVDIDYYDDSGAITCTGAVAPSTPTRAVITATSTANKTQVGAQPVRKVQSEVLLTPITNPGANAAIFSAAGFDPKSNFEVEPAITGESADVWIDTGSWECKGNSGSGGGKRTVGSVFVPAGNLTIDAACEIQGDVWVQNNLVVTGNAYDAPITGTSGNVTVRSGTFTLGKAIEIPGAAKLGGAAPSGLTAVGGITANLGAAAIPTLSSVGLPQLEWNAATRNVWVSEGFTIKDAAALGNLQKDSWGGSGGSAQACGSWSMKNGDTAVQLPTGENVFDLTSCGAIDIKKAEFELHGDTAFIVNGISAITTTLKFYTTDVDAVTGELVPHKVWIIVPYSTGGGISSQSTSFEVVSPVSAFVYAPGTIDLNPHGDFRGQIYGGVVAPKNKFTMDYTFVGVPGVDLAEGTSAIIGYDVELVNKHEVS
ncbi:hypothetical protein QQX09_01335 [Demequina sp. SYSU T00192]|uniref:Uncharacterized protein n=1 Tax=Demequina litoralis TaxID=3051660 RepID=A0ABT8G5T3_9MICO|nr:hypothetical protein [Demequina sp. SYSU T00192]MDN4474493.1 hypothetical protein [Demequina sp. SYSU T00192]